ncbi:hypothetical protein ATETN484_0008009600 [Aspergillus terreus]|nr:hypothetical protein ATETN484_0008009600 [Aspergillus terreus]
MVDATEKPPLDTILNSYDFEQAAAIFGPKKAYTFYSTAATDCWTRDANEAMLKRIWFRPRVMKDVSEVDTSSTVLNIPVKLPLFICPTGLARLINPEAEKGLARAAKSTGILEILSTNAGHPVGEIVQEAPDYPFLFQLYLNKQKEKSRETLRMAESLGMKAIFLTVDAAGRGKRESDERLRVYDAVEIVNPVTGERVKPDKKGGGLTRAMGSYIDQGMTWRDIAWIRSVTRLPIILKGITNAEDAKIAMQHNVEGMMLSNHGGRNLDYTPPSILLLLELHKNCPEVFDRMEIYVDGGFRRGGDIIKALCLGAKAVGIEHLVELLKEEMESVMKLIGIKNLSEVHPGLVNTLDVDYLVPSGPGHPDRPAILKMGKNTLSQDLHFEKKNKDMIKLPKYARVNKRPIPHAPVASPYAGASVPKIVYVSTSSPFMSAVKRVQKLLRQAEKRATASVDLSNPKKRDQQKLAQIARGQDELRTEEVFVKATGRAIEKALSVGRWFEQRGDEYAVRVKTGSVLVVDDVEEDEDAKRKALEEAERSQQQQQGVAEETVGEDGATADSQMETTVSKSAAKKRKRAITAAAAMGEAELPESRTRWVNMVEIAVSYK